MRRGPRRRVQVPKGQRDGYKLRTEQGRDMRKCTEVPKGIGVGNRLRTKMEERHGE